MLLLVHFTEISSYVILLFLLLNEEKFSCFHFFKVGDLKIMAFLKRNTVSYIKKGTGVYKH